MIMFIFKWIRSLYDKTLELSKRPKAVYWLAAVSFVESSFFPIPPDILLLPLCLANRKKAWFLSAVCTGASLAGGLLGYAIGLFAFDSLGAPILQFYGIMDRYDTIRGLYDEYGAIMVFIAGLSPIPYKVITISSGVFRFSVPIFLFLSLASRGLRFGVEAWVINRFGEPALIFVDKHFNKLTVLAAFLFVGGFLAVKFLIPSH